MSKPDPQTAWIRNMAAEIAHSMIQEAVTPLERRIAELERRLNDRDDYELEQKERTG